jgi:hypothetical protein
MRAFQSTYIGRNNFPQSLPDRCCAAKSAPRLKASYVSVSLRSVRLRLTPTSRSAPTHRAEGPLASISLLSRLHGECLWTDMVHGIGDDALHIGLDQSLRDKKVKRNQWVVHEHQTLTPFQQLAASARVGVAGRCIEQLVERWVYIARVVVTRVHAKRIEKVTGIVKIGAPGESCDIPARSRGEDMIRDLKHAKPLRHSY